MERAAQPAWEYVVLGHLGDAGMQKTLVPPTAAGPAYKRTVTFCLSEF